jgi:Ni/Fe-hydrogenase b-type cytochrome subunit
MSTQQQQLKFPAYVWEAPVRLWHWIMALCMIVLWGTGYFIGTPLPSVPGEAYENFLMGYIRFAHFSAAYIFTVMFLMRVYWAIVGNKQAKEIFLVPFYMLTPSWWTGFFRVVGHYIFIRPKNDWHYGHNQLAMAAMFGMYVLGTLFMIFTGFALSGEGLGREHVDPIYLRYVASGYNISNAIGELCYETCRVAPDMLQWALEANVRIPYWPGQQVYGVKEYFLSAEEDARFKEENSKRRDAEKKHLEEVYQAAFGTWTESDWKSFQSAYEKSLG